MLAAAGLSCSSPGGQLTLLPHPDGDCAGCWRRGTAWEQDVKPRKQNSKKKKRGLPPPIPTSPSSKLWHGPVAPRQTQWLLAEPLGAELLGASPRGLSLGCWRWLLQQSNKKKKKRKYWAKREITKPKENTSLFQFLFAKHKITERCLTWLPCSILFGCSKQRGHSWEGGRGSRNTHPLPRASAARWGCRAELGSRNTCDTCVS